MYNFNNNIYDSITQGLAWLSTKQNYNGSFGTISPLIATALVVEAFTNYAKTIGINPLDCNFQYYNQVNSGLIYILQNGNTTDNSVYFGNISNANMSTGAVLSTLVNLCSNDYIVTLPDSSLTGQTLSDIINKTINFLSASQDPSGGWGVFGCNYDGCDIGSSNNVTSFIVGGLLNASNAGYTIPMALYSGIQDWTSYIQNTCSGGAGNLSPYEGVNILNTAILIQQMYLLGYPLDNTNLIYGETYIANNWYCQVGYLDSGWNDYNNTDYQASYQLMVSLLPYCIMTLKNSCCNIINWFYDVINILLYKQNKDGSWPASNVNYSQSEQLMSTVWAILALQEASSRINCN